MVECTGLENRRTFTGTEGSNPSPSARFKAYVDQDCFWGPVAQLDRASDFGSEGRGFESFRARMVRPASLGLAGRCFFPSSTKEAQEGQSFWCCEMAEG